MIPKAPNTMKEAPLKEVTTKEIISGVTIRPIPSVDHDARGKVYRWCTGLLGKEITIFQRHAGVSFGNHYHKGIDPSRNPERSLLLQGTASFWAYNGLTKERVENILLEEFTEIQVGKGILHGMKAMTDVVLIEYRLTAFDENHPDMYPAETYGAYLKEMELTVK